MDKETPPIHPGCVTPSSRHGKTNAGTQRWKCPDCGKVWTGKRRGRRWGDRIPKTNAERCRERYRRLKERLRVTPERPSS